MSKGQRYVNGRCLILEGAYGGLDAKACAEEHACIARLAGRFVRIVKRNAYLFAVYGL